MLLSVQEYVVAVIYTAWTVTRGICVYFLMLFSVRWSSWFGLYKLIDTHSLGNMMFQYCFLLSSGPQADELSNRFGQISLSRQGSTEGPDQSSTMFQPPIISQHPQQTGFIMASPGQPITASNYSASGHTAPAQQVLQPQSYMQPPQQVSRQRQGVVQLLMNNGWPNS